MKIPRFLPTDTLTFALVLVLASCGTVTSVESAFTSAQPTATRTVYEAVTALTAADDVALACLTTPACRAQVNVTEVKGLAQKAHDDLKAAESVTASPDALSAAWASISAFQTLTASMKVTS